MNERFKTNYFIVARLALMLILSVSSFIAMIGGDDKISLEMTGVSLEMLLLISVYIGLMSVKELFSLKIKRVFLLIALIVFLYIYKVGGGGYIFLGFFTAYEILLVFPGISYFWYMLPIVFALVPGPVGFSTKFLVVVLLALVYIQHEFIVKSYQQRMMEDIKMEQGLKRDMRDREHAAKAELRRSMLQAENQILEERSSLSQTLHDKLGHNINGSIYQLEGVKVLMDKDPEKSRGMIQAVIDQLRTGMDEIRAILRKERPKKKELAMVQLYNLCEDSNNKGVETELNVEGDTGLIPDDIWEIILDNTYEAVSNSMKYARCKHINIDIKVMNRMVRCIVSDDGIGCKSIEDGMGISGMRQRIRTINGTVSFESEAGFTVNMLIPLPEKEESSKSA